MLGSKQEGEVIKLAEEEDNDNVTPPLIPPQNISQNCVVLEEPEPEDFENYRSIINDSTQIMNGVLEFDFGLYECQENPLPFLNQPRFEYHSKSDKNFDEYLDWMVENSFSRSF